MRTDLERQTLDVATPPALPGKVFTEPWTYYHYLLRHQGGAGAASLVGTRFELREITNLFEYEVTGVFSGNEYFTNVSSPGNLGSDTNKFTIDSMAVMVHTSS